MSAIAMNSGSRLSPWRTVVLAGVVAATMDLLFAFTFYGIRVGVTPLQVLQSIGSGLFGRASFEGGYATAAAGFAAHYFILIVAAGLYYVASLRLSIIQRHAVVCGIAFGAAIYIVMHYVVVPLSAAPPFKFNLVNQTCEFINHLVLGVAISLIVVRRRLF